MNNNPERSPDCVDHLTLDQYLETASDASKRVRFTVIVLVVVTVLVFAGFLNSWSHSWSLARLAALENTQNKYSQKILESCLKTSTQEECKEFRKTLHDSLVKASVDNIYILKVPFFGVSFDINDLGLLGGLGLIIVLSMLRLSLRSYIVSLRIGFKAAFHLGQQNSFYDVLAARQLFVFPYLEDRNQTDDFEETIESMWFRSTLRKPVLKFSRNLSNKKDFVKHSLLLDNFEILIGARQSTTARERWKARVLLLVLFSLLVAALIFGAIETILVTAMLALFIAVFMSGFQLAYKAYKEKSDSDIAETDLNTSPHWSSNPQPYLKRIPALICFLPPFVYFLVLSNDFQSREMGMTVDAFRTYTGLIFGALFLVIITGLSLWCIAKWSEIFGLWEEYRKNIDKAST